MSRSVTFLFSLLVAMPLYADEAIAPSLPADLKKTLDDYMSAVNRIDMDGIAATYYFPHFRLAGGKLVVWKSPEDALPMLRLPAEQRQQAMRKALGQEWHETRWVKRELIAISDDKAHINTEFVRLRKDGSELGSYNSLYILTQADGVWKIKGRSSFAN